jgi:ketosteroid isomerase-like protein
VTPADIEDGVDDRYHEAARDVLRQIGVDDAWKAAMDPHMPPALRQLTLDMLDAYERLDIDWLLAHCTPDIVITQPAEFPDARTYRGEDALAVALVEWPSQWQDFQMKPRRIFALGDEWLVIVTLHRGRPASADIEVEAEIVFLLLVRDGLVARWQMFLSVAEALKAAT